MSIAGVYTIKCLINEKVYIRSSVNIKQRWQSHRKRCLERNKRLCAIWGYATK